MVSSKLLILVYRKKFTQKITLINLKSQNLLNSQSNGWHLKVFIMEYSLKNQMWLVLNDILDLVWFNSLTHTVVLWYFVLGSL